MSIDLHTAEALFRGEGLSVPALPPELAALLQERAPGIHATRKLAARPYDLEVYVGEVLAASSTPDYAVLAIDGRGVNSWAMHYFLVRGPLALFIQLPWGGAYTNPEAARAEIERVLAWANRLPARLDHLWQLGRLAPQRRLLVVLSRFVQPRWAWVDLPAAAPEDIAWQADGQMLSRIDAELDTLGN